MQSEGNENASPRPNSRRNQKARQQPPSDIADTQSDSNLPTASTPKSRKTPRQHQNGDRTSSLAASSNRQSSSASGPKNRPASGAASHGHIAATPSKASYAGAAFHASPAPSSLPVPRFFSKSVPSANADAGLQAKLEREGSGHGSPSPSLAPRPANNQSKSPLDMFFNADRQEKARLSHAPPQTETPTKAKEMFMFELDEASSPASQHPTPVPLRRQLTTERARTAPDNVPTVNSDEARRAAQTQSLKAFLNITSAEADNTPPPNHSSGGTPHQQPSFATPPSHAHQQPDLLYGNRNLSPMFQAARSPHNNNTPPSHQGAPTDAYNRSPYGSVYNNLYTASPSKPPPHNYSPYPQSPSQHTAHHPSLSGPHSHSTQPNHNILPPKQANGASELQEMEDRMKRMLRMS